MAVELPSLSMPFLIARTKGISVYSPPTPPRPEVRLDGARVTKSGSSSSMSPERLSPWHSTHRPMLSTRCLPLAIAAGPEGIGTAAT